MSLQSDSKYHNDYFNHVSGKKKTKGTLGIVFDIIADISDRRGLKQEWEQIDGGIQDEIIETWKNKIIDSL